MTSTKPTKQDLKNYNYDLKNHPLYSRPGDFLKLGDRVVARFRIFDLPQSTLNADWGPVHAEAFEEGVVVHVQEGHWPTVRFNRTGTATCVTPFEVCRLNDNDTAQVLEVMKLARLGKKTLFSAAFKKLSRSELVTLDGWLRTGAALQR